MKAAIFSVTIAAFALSSNAVAKEAPCDDPIEIDAAVFGDEARFIIVGEIHGTDTAPKVFGDIVCSGAIAGPVNVHLELPNSLKSAFADFIENGSEAALTEITDHWIFRSKHYDGRGSAAVYQLILRLRSMSANGLDIVVTPFQPTIITLRPQYYYELAMAEHWTRAAAERPEAMNYVLVGNFHAQRATDSAARQSAASFLMPSDYIALDSCAEGGTASAINMNDEGVIESTIIKLPKIGKKRGRGIYAASAFDEPENARSTAKFDGFYCAGKSSNASGRAFPERLKD